MLSNSITPTACLAFAAALLIVAILVELIAPWLRRLPQRIREHDDRARMNRQLRAADEARWKELERRAEFRAGMHHKLTSGA
jgi:predicted exporter